MNNLYPTIGNVTRIEYGEQPVVTTAQLAEFYETIATGIQQNFNSNEDRFISGKHYFKLEGDALKEFKDCSAESRLQISTMTRALYLWMKRGTDSHAKIFPSTALGKSLNSSKIPTSTATPGATSQKRL